MCKSASVALLIGAIRLHLAGMVGKIVMREIVPHGEFAYLSDIRAPTFGRLCIPRPYTPT